MKKGFTLVEVLGVIVLLTVISLIAVPRISRIIANTKKTAAKNSALGYVDAVDKQQAFNFNDNKADNNILAGFYQVPIDDVYEIEYNGKKPTSGWIEMTSNGANRYSIVLDGFVITYNGKRTYVTKGNKPAKQAYPTYAYSNSFSITRVGYPIDGGFDLGYKWVAKVDDVSIPFESEEECKSVAPELNAECVYDTYVTSSFDNKSAPDNSWKDYLKYTLSKSGMIEKIEGCVKYKGDEHCLAPNVSVDDFAKSQKRLNDIFEAENCIDDGYFYKCNKEGLTFNVCPYGCVGVNYNTNRCDITSYGLAACNTYE